MITRPEEHEIMVKQPNQEQPDQPNIVIEKLLTSEEYGDQLGMFAKITIREGCELPVHEHHGETETYYVLEGEGLYLEQGKESTIQKGDVTFCPDGGSHGVKNIGKGDFVFIGLIVCK